MQVLDLTLFHIASLLYSTTSKAMKTVRYLNHIRFVCGLILFQVFILAVIFSQQPSGDIPMDIPLDFEGFYDFSLLWEQGANDGKSAEQDAKMKKIMFPTEPSLDCKEKLIIIAKTGESHFNLRNSIRKTWGDDAKSYGIFVIFVIGHSGDSTHLTELAIAAEVQKYQDILRVNANDKSDGQKILFSLIWHGQSCLFNSSAIFFTGGFSLVLPERVLKIFSNVKMQDMIIWCDVVYRIRQRTAGTEEEEEEFCKKVGYLLGSGVSRVISSEYRNQFGYFVFDDLKESQITGMLAKKAGINLRIPKVKEAKRKMTVKLNRMGNVSTLCETKNLGVAVIEMDLSEQKLNTTTYENLWAEAALAARQCLE